MIDYILTNRNIHYYQIIDVRRLSSANMGSIHNLVLGKIRMNITKNPRNKTPTYGTNFNVEQLRDESTKYLYQSR